MLATSVQVQRAYNLYSNCYAITEDQNLQEHIRSLGDDLSDYYLTRAKHFVGLPAGTGVNVGWYYLSRGIAVITVKCQRHSRRNERREGSS